MRKLSGAIELQEPVDAIGRAAYVQERLNTSSLRYRYKVTLDNWTARISVLGLRIKPEDFPWEVWVGGTRAVLWTSQGTSGVSLISNRKSAFVRLTEEIIIELGRWECIFHKFRKYIPRFKARLRRAPYNCKIVWDCDHYQVKFGCIPKGLVSDTGYMFRHDAKGGYTREFNRILKQLKFLKWLELYIEEHCREFDIFNKYMAVWDRGCMIMNQPKRHMGEAYRCYFGGKEPLYGLPGLKDKRYTYGQFLDELVAQGLLDPLYIACYKQKRGL